MSPAHQAAEHNALSTALPESRVLIISTGGTICMQQGPDGLQPSEGFLESAMAPRPSFNDESTPSGWHHPTLETRRRPNPANHFRLVNHDRLTDSPTDLEHSQPPSPRIAPAP